MPIALRRILSLAFLALALAACSKEKRGGEPRMPADEPEAAEHPTGISAEEGYRAQPTPPPSIAPAPKPAPTAYACTGGGKVELGYLVARVTLPDGRTEQISRDPDDAAHFGDGALAFRSRGDTGELTRSGRTVACAGE